jgi:hypothetical protein
MGRCYASLVKTDRAEPHLHIPRVFGRDPLRALPEKFAFWATNGESFVPTAALVRRRGAPMTPYGATVVLAGVASPSSRDDTKWIVFRALAPSQGQQAGNRASWN